MAKYLLEVNDTLDGVKGVKSQGGSARQAAAQDAAASVGGQIEELYSAFGSIDVFIIADFQTTSRPPRSLWQSPRPVVRPFAPSCC